MSQSRRASLIESISSTLFGFGVAVIANYAILPLFGFVPRIGESLMIALLFTLVSVVRSYLFRRLFNYLLLKGIIQ